MSKGTYIVLEGPDGGGTTTHAPLLVKHLRSGGHSVLQTAEPTDGPLGQNIRAQLKGKGIPPDALQMLFSADRAWHMSTRVNPALEKGEIVVGERCAISTFIYGEALGLDVPWLEAINSKFRAPDLVLFLTAPFATCQERLGVRDRDILEGNSFQKKIHTLYATYAQTHPNVIVIDTTGDIPSTAKQIADQVDAFLSRR